MGVAWTDHRFKEEGVVPLNVRSWYPNAHCDYFAPFGIIENRLTKINEMGNTVFSWAKRFIERWYLLITEKVLFWTFRWWKIRSFLSQEVGGKMIFTGYGEVLVLNFSVMGNTVFFAAKTLMERWYLHGLFELSMIFQDLGKTVFRAVIKKVCCVKILNLTILCKQFFACSV